MSDLDVVLWKLLDLSEDDLIIVKEEIEKLLNQNKDDSKDSQLDLFSLDDNSNFKKDEMSKFKGPGIEVKEKDDIVQLKHIGKNLKKNF